jgi:hypothetical protein
MKDVLDQATQARDVRVAQPIGTPVLNYQKR